MNSLQDFFSKLPIDKVYDDLLHPSFSAIGTGVRDLLRLAFSPVEFFSEKTRLRMKYHLDLYKEKMEKVGEEDQVNIPDEFGIPILRKLAQTDQKELSEKYLNLLAKAGSNSEIENVHPRYITILDSLSVDEIKIIDEIKEGFQNCAQLIVAPIVGSKAHLSHGFGDKKASPLQTLDAITDTLRYPRRLSQYLDNVVSLGLFEFLPERRFLVFGKDEFDKEKETFLKILEPFFHEAKSYASRLNNHEVFLEIGYLHLTQFGKAFYNACQPIKPKI